ncbi:CatA-like O-acetyltransferase [bacterium]|nr:CatA-like O-acetyltransferase [bacterium]
MWEFCRAHSLSIHHALLYCTLSAANKFRPMRLRRKDDGVVEHSSIDMGCSVLKNDSDAFTFAYYPWNSQESMLDFIHRSSEITQKAAAGLPLDPRPDRTNLMYGTTIPWISFTSFTHPKKGEGHSIPRTVFGKIFQREGKYYLPFQLEVDHALMDGLHIARYFELLQQELNAPS